MGKKTKPNVFPLGQIFGAPCLHFGDQSRELSLLCALKVGWIQNEGEPRSGLADELERALILLFPVGI